MTKRQEAVLKAIEQQIERFDFYGHPEAYEVKEWKVTENCDRVELVFETGRKNDEGTMAAILCRKRRQAFISPRGSITVIMWNAKLRRVIQHKYVSVFDLMNKYYEH